MTLLQARALMKFSPPSADNTIIVSSSLKFVPIDTDSLNTNLHQNIKWLNRVLQVMLYIDLVIAILSFAASIQSQFPIALISTGLLGVLAAIMIILSNRQLAKSKNWVEVCILALCSVYAPFFVLWIAIGNLLTVIVNSL